MNVLVTGANGFIGRALCKRLLAEGWQVRGAVRGAAQMTALVSERSWRGDVGQEPEVDPQITQIKYLTQRREGAKEIG